jgi:glucose/arabinose dehydrogenase
MSGRETRWWSGRQQLGGFVVLASIQLVLLLGCADSGPVPAEQPVQPTPVSVSACDDSAPVLGRPSLDLALVARNFERPVDLEAPAGDCRLFVVEQTGRIRVIRDGQVLATPFLDISDRVRTGGERGLLGLAFHPDYASNGRFFLDYIQPNGNTRITEMRAPNPSADTADPTTERIIMRVPQPYANHNGGKLAFGNDGFLYIGLGDGGSAGDPQGNAQNLQSRLGKLLRIDVDGASPFSVPDDNPFVGRDDALPEIWAYGLRNPWRFAFDSETGDLLIGDVGQAKMEEIDLGRAARGGGENYGWHIMEGTNCYRPRFGCDQTGLTAPIATYTHAEGCSITGGVVYRGRRMPGYHGVYFYSDFCTGFLRSLRVENGQAVSRRDWTSSLGTRLSRVTSFGVDADGEAYVVTVGGEIYRIVPQV